MTLFRFTQFVAIAALATIWVACATPAPNDDEEDGRSGTADARAERDIGGNETNDVGATRDVGFVTDTGGNDAVADDAGAPDAGAPDAGTPDAGAPDAETPDAETPDTGTPDTGTPDAGTPDTGTPDAGTPYTGILSHCTTPFLDSKVADDAAMIEAAVSARSVGAVDAV